MVPRVETGGLFFFFLERLLSTEALKRYTRPTTTLLCSTRLAFPGGDISVVFDFYEQRAKRKMYFRNLKA